MKTIALKIAFTFLAFWLAGSLNLAAQSPVPTKAGGNESVLLTVEGKVEISRTGTTPWLAAQTNLVVNLGDRVRTGLRSRAVVRFSNLAVLRVNELTTFVVQPPSAPGKPARLDLKSGSTYFLSRERPADVEFSTPLSSGAIRGTEFHLAVAENDGRSVVTLIDGALSISNSLGAVDLASGEQAVVEPGQPPKKTAVINAINIIQWCLYYPGVLDVDELGLTGGEQQTLADSLGAYRSGDLLRALDNYPAGRAPSSDAEKIYFAALLLAVGQVEQSAAQLNSLSAASPLGQSLREVVAAVKNEVWIRPAPATTATEWLADSYYLQSRSKLDEALKAARKSVAKSPNFGFGWARVAELEFSFGRVPAAREALDKSLKISPRNAQAVSLKGFLFAAQNKVSAARQQFDEAIAIDGGLGNAWLGRGLVRIHAGDAEGGRRDLQVAATLEPQRALLRSYLGKAFGNARDNRHAQKEFALAKKLDPNDPTVWLYAALLDQQENRINDAVGDLEKSQALNDNRSVYRSRLLLDQDRAVRGANLANIYRDDGMTDVSLREAVKAVNADYANYSAHLFLANSFYDQRDPNRINLRYETPYVSEYLVANLLAPVGAGTLSQQVSQQEYSKLFERDGVGVSSSTEYWSHGDWRQSAAEYGTYGNTSFALEQTYLSQHGYRPNSDLTDVAYDFRLKQQLTSKDNVYVQASFDNSSGGNLTQYYNQATAAGAPFRFREQQAPIIIAGFHHEWAPGMDTLLLASRLEDTFAVANPNQLSQSAFLTIRELPGKTIEGILPFIATENYSSKLVIYSTELQQIWQTHKWTTVAGARFQIGSFDTSNLQTTTDINIFGFFPATTIASQNVSARFERENVYAYEQWQPLESLRLIGGVSYDHLVIPENFRYSPVNENSVTSYHLLPKAGVIWTPLKNTTVRAAYSESVGGASFDQSFQLEPTQVAGFNQAFRSLIPESIAGANAGATFTIYGVSLEQKFPTRTYLAVAADLLKSRVQRQDGAFEYNLLGGPFLSKMGERLNFREATVSLSAHQLVGRDWAFGTIYRLSRARLADSFTEITPGNAAANGFLARTALTGTMHNLDLRAIWQHPSGFFAQADATWTLQNNHGYPPARNSENNSENFWQCDVLAGYRFLHRQMEVTVGILNLTAQNYHLSPLNLYQERPRDRTFYTQLKFQF